MGCFTPSWKSWKALIPRLGKYAKKNGKFLGLLVRFYDFFLPLALVMS
jgi:hypothetical protein